MDQPTIARMEPAKKAWYTLAITGATIYGVQAKGLRHFTTMTPLPGLTALCGAIVTEDDAEVKLTCQTCSQMACKQKTPSLPGADDGGKVEPPVKG